MSWKPLPAGKASHTADQLIPRRGSHEQLQLFSVLAHGPEWYYRTTPLKCLPPEDLYRYRSSGPHNAGATGAALASGSASGGLEDGHSGLLVTVRYGSTLPGRRRQMRSANSRTCVVKRTYSSYGDRCFAAEGPRLWNSLPAHLRQTDINFEQFKRQLKTFLFGG